MDDSEQSLLEDLHNEFDDSLILSLVENSPKILDLHYVSSTDGFKFKV